MTIGEIIRDYMVDHKFKAFDCNSKFHQEKIRYRMLLHGFDVRRDMYVTLYTCTYKNPMFTVIDSIVRLIPIYVDRKITHWHLKLANKSYANELLKKGLGNDDFKEISQAHHYHWRTVKNNYLSVQKLGTKRFKNVIAFVNK